MNGQTIFNFNKNSDISNWLIVDDIVMGGKSFGKFYLNSEGNGVFEGEISLENRGGFSSVRYQFNKINIEKFSKIVLYLKGSGNRFQLRIKNSTRNYYSYINYFNTSGEWQEIEIPLKDFYPSFRGQKLDLPNFSDKFIEEIGFLIGNSKVEKFKLQIVKIELKI